MSVPDLRAFIDLLRRADHVVEVTAAVDPYLEAAEIHRRVIAAGGPALIFRNIKGADFPLVTNLVGTARRAELAFGERPLRLIKRLVQLVEKFRASEVALIGLRGTASRLREDGCGIPVGADETAFDFVDGSAMALRSEVVRRCGLFDPAFTADHFWRETRRRTAAIKLALMDNRLVVGVGNIYANEALFCAGIRPTIAAYRLSRPRLQRLVDCVRAVLTEAIAKGGSTLRDYVDARGEPGYFQLDYCVYGREGEPCRICGTAIRHLRLGGRASFHCPVCQR